MIEQLIATGLGLVSGIGIGDIISTGALARKLITRIGERDAFKNSEDRVKRNHKQIG